MKRRKKTKDISSFSKSSKVTSCLFILTSLGLNSTLSASTLAESFFDKVQTKEFVQPKEKSEKKQKKLTPQKENTSSLPITFSIKKQPSINYDQKPYGLTIAEAKEKVFSKEIQLKSSVEKYELGKKFSDLDGKFSDLKTKTSPDIALEKASPKSETLTETTVTLKANAPELKSSPSCPSNAENLIIAHQEKFQLKKTPSDPIEKDSLDQTVSSLAPFHGDSALLNQSSTDDALSSSTTATKNPSSLETDRLTMPKELPGLVAVESKDSPLDLQETSVAFSKVYQPLDPLKFDPKRKKSISTFNLSPYAGNDFYLFSFHDEKPNSQTKLYEIEQAEEIAIEKSAPKELSVAAADVASKPFSSLDTILENKSSFEKITIGKQNLKPVNPSPLPFDDSAITTSLEFEDTLALHNPHEEHPKDLYGSFFQKLKDPADIDLKTFIEKNFVVSEKATIAHTFYPTDSILLSKAGRDVDFNTLQLSDDLLALMQKTKDLQSLSVSLEDHADQELALEDKTVKTKSSLEDLSPNNLRFIATFFKNDSIDKSLQLLNNSFAKNCPLKFSLETFLFKPYKIYSDDQQLASTFLESDFKLNKTGTAETSFISQFTDPHLQNSRKFEALAKVFKPKLKNYSVLIQLPGQMKTKKPIDLLENIRTKLPSLVEGKTKLLPTRNSFSRLNKTVRVTNNNLDNLPSLRDLSTFSLSEEFTTDVAVAKYKNGKGYLFSITLEPINKKLFARAPHNFIFLVDKSGSIQESRYDVFKKAVTKSLKYLKDGDTFNIYTFDSKLTPFSKESVYYTPSTKIAAKHFIEKEPRSHRYSQPNLYKLLGKIRDVASTSQLPTSVILLTNGKTLENIDGPNKQLTQLIENNHDNFFLYANCASHANNETMLEVLSVLNKGSLMHSQTFAAFPRKVATVVKHAGHLLAHSIHVNKAHTNQQIEFFPDPKLTRNFFSDKPYTIIGYAKDLCDFELVVQGRLGDEWMNLKKDISLKEATKDGKTLHRQLATYQAYNKYYEFLNRGNSELLDEASKLLKPYK